MRKIWKVPAMFWKRVIGYYAYCFFLAQKKLSKYSLNDRFDKWIFPLLILNPCLKSRRKFGVRLKYKKMNFWHFVLYKHKSRCDQLCFVSCLHWDKKCSKPMYRLTKTKVINFRSLYYCKWSLNFVILVRPYG